MATNFMSPDVIVVGAGGHAKVCIELLQSMGQKVLCCVGGMDGPTHCLGIPVLVGDKHLHAIRMQGFSKAFVAVGSNSLRGSLASLCISYGYQLVAAISPHAVVSPSAKIGLGVAVMPGAVINADSIINDLAIVNTAATIDHDCRIDYCAHIAPQCVLGGNVTVGEFSFLGVGCKVIPNISIGERVTAGAGAVIIRNIESDAKVVGVPARSINK
jgi:UDP-perosamine 4-acetyltransferase